MSNLNINPRIIKGVTINLDRSLDTIKNNFEKKEFEIKDVPSSINDLLQKVNCQKQAKATITNYQLIKRLKSTERSLQNSLFQLTHNQKVIEDKNLNLLTTALPTENNLHKSQLKQIKETKEDLISKIDTINYQIQKLIANEKQSAFFIQKKQNIKAFIDNMERDKELAEIRMKKYEQESKRRREKIKQELTQITERRIQEFEIKEKESIALLTQKQKEKRETEKDLIIKRAETNKNRLIKLKPYINELPQKKANNKRDLYIEFENRFLLKEEKVLKTECDRRKQRAAPITHEDFNEYQNDHFETEERIRNKCEEEILKRQEEWIERKEMLPTYHNDVYLQYENKEQEDKIEKENEKKALKAIKNSYASNIVQPPISRKKRRVRRNNIRKSKPLSLLQYKKRFKIKPRIRPDFKHRKKIIRIKKRNPNKPSKFNWKLKLDPKEFEINKNNIIKKPIHLNLAKSFDKSKRNLLINPPKVTDYLKEFREQKQTSSPQPMIYKEIKWNKIMNNKEDTISNKVDYIKMKAMMLEEKAKLKEQFIKLNGGSEKHPELSAEAANLIVNSIKAKLSILDSASKQSTIISY